MTILSVYDALKNGVDSMISDPIAESVGYLNSISSGASSLTGGALDSLGSALSSIKDFASAAEAYMANELQAIKIKLPIMAAVDKQQKQGNFLDGIRPGTDGGSTLQNSCQGLLQLPGMLGAAVIDLQGHMGNINGLLTSTPGSTPQDKLTNFASTIPAPTDPTYATFVANNAETLTGLSSIGGGIAGIASDSTGFLTNMIASENANVSAGISQLKSVAFANFASSDQPPSVRKILNRFIPAPTANTYVATKMMASASRPVSNQASAESPVHYSQHNPETVPAAPPTIATPVQVASLSEQSGYNSKLHDNYDVLHASTISITAQLQALIAYKITLNYDAIKQDALNNPTDAVKQQTYQDLKAAYIANPLYVQYVSDSGFHDKAVAANEKNFALTTTNANGAAPHGLTAAMTQFGTLNIWVFSATV